MKFRYTGLVIKSIFNAPNLGVTKAVPHQVCMPLTGRLGKQALVCLLAFFGSVATASAGVQLRFALATSSVPSGPASHSQSEAALAAKREAKRAEQAALREQVQALVQVYAGKSDEELTALSARWQDLPSLDRQVLIREVKLRMARQRGRKGSVQIRTERRFGRLLRQADGSVVRVETRVVRVRPANSAAKPAADSAEATSPVRMRKSAYGAGFERRSAPTAPPPPSEP